MNLRKIIRIAIWEVTQGRGLLTRETLLFAITAVTVTAVILGGVGSLSADEGLYTVGVASDNPYHSAVEQHTSLQTVPPNKTKFKHGEIDILIRGEQVFAQNTKKGQSAASELEKAIERHNYALMKSEDDSTAAFPVAVSVVYVPPQAISSGESLQSLGSVNGSQSNNPTATPGEGNTSEVPVSGSSETEREEEPPTANKSEQDGTSQTTTPDKSTSERRASENRSGDTPANSTAMDNSDSSGGSGSSVDTPASLAPPFPFKSLLLAFAYIIPMNFIVQVYGSSIMNERLRNRGELLLVSPVTNSDIIAGKTVPYLSASVAVCAAITVYIGGGVESALATIPLSTVFLAAGFLAAMYARSYNELTFVTLAASVAITAYAFLPAVFTTVHPLSIISPLYVVVSDIRGETVPLFSFLVSTMPLFLTSGLMFALGTGVYTEEGMFTQRRLSLKFLDSLTAQVYSLRSYFLLGAITIPFVFAVELLALTALILFPETVSIPVLLGIVAVIEEIAKSLPVYATSQTRGGLTRKSAAIAGLLSGAGFFLAEKMTAIVQKTSLTSVGLSELVFKTVGPVGGEATVFGLGLLVVWPFLHSITAMVSSVFALRGKWMYIAGVGLASLIHLLYNLSAVIIYG